MRNPKILAVSYTFPPMAYPRSVQVSRLFSSISAQVKVVCGSCEREQTDETIMLNNSGKFDEIIRIPFVFSGVSRCLNIFDNNRIIPIFNLPDKQRRWARKALKCLLQSRFISNYKPDLLMTFSTPVSDHLFGLEYKRRAGIPWIAHFSDPWSDNPYVGQNALTRRLNVYLERKVIKNADALIFTSPETIDLVMRKYPSGWKEKAFYIPHCLDRALYSDNLRPPANKYVLRYVGNFYGLRSPLPLYEAIERVGRNRPDLFKDVLFELAGSAGRFSGLIDRFPAARRVVKLTGKVSYTESLRLMQTAHCLLVIDAPGDYSVFFPSKLVDYIGADRFILAFSPPGTVSRVVKEAGGIAVDLSDMDAVVKVLKNVLEHRPSKLTSRTFRYDYDMEAVGKEVCGIIDSVLSKKTGEEPVSNVRNRGYYRQK